MRKYVISVIILISIFLIILTGNKIINSRSFAKNAAEKTAIKYAQDLKLDLQGVSCTGLMDQYEMVACDILTKTGERVLVHCNYSAFGFTTGCQERCVMPMNKGS